MAFGESVPTVQVVSRKGRKRMEIINEADFDPKKDQLWEDYQKAQQEEEDQGTHAVEEQDKPQRPHTGGTITPRADGLHPSKGGAPIDTPTLKGPTTTAGAPEHPPGKMPPSSGSTTPDKQGDKK
jgi:hypothetical protein